MAPPVTVQAQSTSWADEHLSDTELIFVSDETLHEPSDVQTCPAIGTSEPKNMPPYGGAPSGTGMKHNDATPQTGQAVDLSRRSEKRGNDGQLERPDSRQSYAQATTKYDWNTVDHKRMKRNSAMVLLGAKTTSQK